LSDNDKVKWTLDLITKLQSTNTGDKARLDLIKSALELGNKIDDNDKNYLKELHSQLQNSSSNEATITSEVQRDLMLLTRLKKTEIGNPERLGTIKNYLSTEQSISEDDRKYLNEKFDQLKKIDSQEGSILLAHDTINKLQISEIGNPERLEGMKKHLELRGSLPDDDISYLKEKANQLKKIEKTEPVRELKPRPKPVDPDAKYCAFCQRSVHPERDFSVGALVVLLFLGILPGIIYYFLKAATCPICKHHQWQIPPDD